MSWILSFIVALCVFFNTDVYAQLRWIGCPIGELYCTNDSQNNEVGCISNTDSRVCDGVQDCGGNIDEERCVDGKFCDKFVCNSASGLICLRDDQWCDGVEDCLIPEDEWGCKDSKWNNMGYDYANRKFCPNGTIDCNFGSHNNDLDCISNTDSRVCDGVQDCRENVDEAKCVDGKLCDKFACDSPSGRICLRDDQWCDGVEDCLIGTDEWGCKDSKPDNDIISYEDYFSPKSCPSGMFVCTNRNYGFECISKTDSSVCDGVQDCYGSEDEICIDGKHCGTLKCSTPSGDGTVCMTDDIFCNGVDDCLGGTDERGCKDSKWTRANDGLWYKLD